MSAAHRALLLLGLAVLSSGALSSGALAAAPAWKLTVASEPTNFAPGSVPGGFSSFGHYPEYNILATNVGSAPSSGPITITDTLPAGVTPVEPQGRDSGVDGLDLTEFPCAASGQTVSCTDLHTIGPGRVIQVSIPVAVAPDAAPSLINQASIVGGGSGEARATTTTTIDSRAAAFGLASGSAGLSLALTAAQGAPVTQAGSHPYQVTIDGGFSTALAAQNLIGASHVRDLHAYLPRGMTLDPTATPVLCTEAQLESNDCPDASAIGFASFQTILTSPTVGASPLYNMVPPPGSPLELALNPFGLNLFFLHFLGGANAAGKYQLSLNAAELPAGQLRPVISIQVQLWGNPTDPSHDGVRGACVFAGGSCPVKASDRPFLTMPGSCLGPLAVGIASDTWEDPGRMLEYSAGAEEALGEPVSLEGCNKLEFAPTIEAKPTTNLADSPSGLDLELHLPQSQDLDRLAEANLKDTRITLPEGMAINPPFAGGAGACTRAEVDLGGPEPASCPPASRLGTVEVKTPLLDHALPGALYLAKPLENPSRSLLALYLVIHDPQSGIVVKLAGKVEADPQSGQLTVSFPESPELPLEELEVHLFGGPRAPFRTPSICATYGIASVLTPWSAPEGVDARSSDRFAISASPGGGPCPTAEAALPSAPSFSAGTVAPKAGVRSPFVLKLSRGDGTQPLGKVEATLPEGLLGGLAGIPYCSPAGIAQAQSRFHPGEGALEQASPSCPAASELGTVDIGAGAGLVPLHLRGRVYLAGPYKGAALSLVTIVPALGGPFDLGAVVVRSALRVDAATTQVQAISDPLPQILNGIPLDVRSIAWKLDRPGFSSNPTSCEPMTVTGAATSALGAATALSSPFQVGNCRGLGFSPKLSLRLGSATGRGGHPAIRAALTFPAAGEPQADLASARLALPRSLTLDRSSIGALCGGAQLAARQCPATSAFGHLTAKTPLLDKPLQGPVYLRPSGRDLPELVAVLGGQLEVAVAARLNLSRGRLRASFGSLPDAPLSKLVLSINGGRRGLVRNRANLCKTRNRVTASFEGQNGKVDEASPLIAVSCKESSRRGGRRGRRGRR